MTKNVTKIYLDVPITLELAQDKEIPDWLLEYCHRKSVDLPPQADGSLYACPCCGQETLPERGGYDICPICGWEDDGQDEATKDEVWAGPNDHLSLSEARAMYTRHGDIFGPGDPRHPWSKRHERARAQIQQGDANDPE